MKFRFLTLTSLCILSNQLLIAQTSTLDPRKPDIVNFGPGIGFDYGGLGVNFMVYPQKNIGIFFGGGYALAGFGYNTGVKLRLTPDKGTVVNPFLTAMYGYNAAVVISDNSQLNKLFYGPTIGVGIDIRPRKPSSKGYLSLALMIPLRNSDAQNYIDFLKNEYGASFANDLLPVGFSIGYKFILNSN
jgi:hypothetical protein